MRKTEKRKRRLFIVDIENYRGKSLITERDARGARSDIEKSFNLNPADLVVVGTSHPSNFLSAKIAWPGVEHCLRRGHNGADLALIESAEAHMSNIETFSEVVVLSGDGIFTRLVRRIKERGVKATVASLANQVNRSLAESASVLMLLKPAAQA